MGLATDLFISLLALLSSSAVVELGGASGAKPRSEPTGLKESFRLTCFCCWSSHRSKLLAPHIPHSRLELQRLGLQAQKFSSGNTDPTMMLTV